jgi:PAS domain S-box-containing protein
VQDSTVEHPLQDASTAVTGYGLAAMDAAFPHLGAPILPPRSSYPRGLDHPALAATRDAVVCTAPDGRIQLFNPAAERMFGFLAGDVVGLALDAVFPHAARELAELFPGGHAGDRAPAQVERTLTCARVNGSTVRADARIVPAVTPDGTYLTFLLQIHSDEKRALAELSLLKGVALAIGGSEDLLTALELTLQQIGTFTGWTAGESWLPDPTGEVLRRGPVWSRAAERLRCFHTASEALAFRRSEGLPGRAWASGTAEWIEDVTTHEGFLRPAVARECGLHAGFAIPVLAGRRVVAVIVFYHTDSRAKDAALVDLVAAVAAQLGTLVQRKQAEDELLRHSAELARSNAELEQFAYVASHDLQEPLRMVASYTQLLERRYRDRLDEDAREFIGFAVEGTKRMQQLLRELLDFSRVRTRGEVFEPVDLDHVLRDVLQGLVLRIEECDARITWDPLPRLCVDAVQIRQVLHHLVGNAIKFRRDEQPQIHLSVRRANSEWVFSCRDNGIGIEGEFFDRIFIIFQRLHSRAEFPGNGSGLSICKKIIERHGGRIWLESTPGKGSTFYFSLPACTEPEE